MVNLIKSLSLFVIFGLDFVLETIRSMIVWILMGLIVMSLCIIYQYS